MVVPRGLTDREISVVIHLKVGILIVEFLMDTKAYYFRKIYGVQ